MRRSRTSCTAALLVLVAAGMLASTDRANAFLSPEEDVVETTTTAPEPQDVGEGSFFEDPYRGMGMGKGGKGGTNTVNGGDDDCNVCGDTPSSKGGKLNALTFQWDAAVEGTAATISVEGVTAVVTGLADGDEAEFIADRSYFRADTAFTINGEVINLHTSCSQPIYRGMVVTFDGGTLTITGFESTMRDGMPWSSSKCEPPCVVPVIANCLNACGDSFPPSTDTCSGLCITACVALAGADATATAECSGILTDWSTGKDVAAVCDPPPEPDVGCNLCGSSPTAKGGKLRALTFLWTANTFGTGATISVAEQKHGPLTLEPTNGEVPDRGSITMGDASNKFKANTALTVNGVTVNLHTSCSQPIYVGLRVSFPGQGSLEITGFASVAKDGTERTGLNGVCEDAEDPDEEPGCNLCGDSPTAKGGKLSSLTFEWSANVAGMPATVTSDPTKHGTANPVEPSGFAAVADGGNVMVTAGGRAFQANTVFTVNGVSVTFHTSCSKPLYLGLEIPFLGQGTFTVVDFVSKSKEGKKRSGADCDGVTPPCRQVGDPSVDRECDLCSTTSWAIPHHHGKGRGRGMGKGGKGKKAKLDAIEIVYTGINCAGNDCNMQNNKKARVEGNPASANGLTIAVVGGETFSNIDVGDSFTMTIVPHPATVITMTNAAGSIVSLVEFHSSCSQPLYHGDEFGSLRIVGFETDGGITEADKCNIPEICTTTVPPVTTLPGTPPCDACGGAQGSTVTMLRFQVVAGVSGTSPNNQGGAAGSIGTAMPTGAPDPAGECFATMQQIKDSAGSQQDVNDLYKIYAEGCAPFAARLECTNSAGDVLQTKHNTFRSIEDIAGVPASAWNLLGPGESDAPYIADGAYVVVHNNGAALGDSVSCRIQSPEHYCFGFAYDGVTSNPSKGLPGYLKYSHVTARTLAGEMDFLPVQASSIFPGCAATRTEADAMKGCACLPETQTEPGNSGFPPFISKGDEGNFATQNSAGTFDQTITIDTSCEAGGSKTLNINDQFGMFKLVGFQAEDGRNDMECDACPCNPDNRKVCRGPGFDGADTQSLIGRTICDLELPLTQNKFVCEGNGCVEGTPPEACTCGTVAGVGSDPQEYCMFADGSFTALVGSWVEIVPSLSADPPTFVPVSDMNINTAAVADNTPCCDHYWYTCAILQDAGVAGDPRSGNFDFLATTPEGNLLAALENLGVDMSGVATLDHDTSVDRGNACQVQIDPNKGLGDVSLVLRNEDPNAAGVFDVESCYVDGTIDLYCGASGTYVTNGNPSRKYCCLEPFGLLDATTSDLTIAQCDLPPAGPTVLQSEEPADTAWSWFNFLTAANGSGGGSGGSGFSQGKLYGFGFASCALVMGAAVAAYAHQQSKLGQRRHVTAHPSSSSAPSSAPAGGGGGVYDFESSCGDSAATDPAALARTEGGMAAAAATVQAANLEWESEPAAAQRVANSLQNLIADDNADAGEDAEEDADQDEGGKGTPALSRPQLSEGSSAAEPKPPHPVGSITAII